MEKTHFVVNRISDGLGFGEGKISGRDASSGLLQTIDDAIETDPVILVAVDHDDTGHMIEDDGCGDGREVGIVYRGDDVLKKSLNRAKVFGGAAAMAAAVRVGLGLAMDRTLNDVFDDALKELDEKNIDFGAHTADHVAPGREKLDGGCGAIDGAPAIIRAIAKYKNEIHGVIKSLQVSDEGLDNVFANFDTYGVSLPDQPEYSGLRVTERIKHDMSKVVKELVGAHYERRIVINSVRNFTVNQDLIRKLTNGKAQIFAFDLWRLEDIAANLQPNDGVQRHKALLSELVYTLGVAAVLTPGDMPVYMTQAV